MCHRLNAEIHTVDRSPGYARLASLLRVDVDDLVDLRTPDDDEGHLSQLEAATEPFSHTAS